MTPPQGADTDLIWLRLARSRNVGPRAFRRLLERFGGAERALEALPSLATRGGEAAYRPCSERQARAELDRAAEAGAVLLRLEGPGYPERLAEIADAPALLWALGDSSLLDRPAVAVVGARNASSNGLKLARTLAVDLGARGHVIVSGFARGVDAAAHGAALESGTIACMAGGADVIYPEGNAALARRMRETGGLFLSEAPMGMRPLAKHFPRRNRIVSGLSAGVVLVEAAARSGTLITARFATEQGREVMAVPGSPLDGRAEGCNALIRQGAALIRDVDDVIEALGAPRALTIPRFAAPAPRNTARRPAGPGSESDGLASRALSLIGAAPAEEDALARDLGVDAETLSATLLELELAGRIERAPGGAVSRMLD